MEKNKLTWQQEAKSLGIPYHFRKKEDVINEIIKTKTFNNSLNNIEKKEENKKIKMIIITDDSHKEDILNYENFLNEITTANVDLYIFGLHIDKNEKFLTGIKYNYVKPTSIISLFKEINEINADIVFVPLIFNKYNMTSSDYIIYLISSLFAMPILAPDFYPFNEIIQNSENGFLYSENNIQKVFNENINLKNIKNAGYIAKKNIIKSFSINKENIEYFFDKFN